MRLRNTLLTVLLVSLFTLFFGSLGVASEGPVDIFLLIGQSNMAGRGAIGALDVAGVEGAYLFTGKGWEVLRNPLNRYSTVIAGDPAARLSPGYTFARKVTEMTGRSIGIVSNARGGTRIEQWQKGFNGANDFDLYENAVQQARLALELTPGARLAGIIWHQGEGDNNATGSSLYMGRLERLVTDLRTDLNSPDATLIVGEVGMWNGRGTRINPVLRSVETRLENAYWVSASGLVPLPSANGSPNMTDPHFNTLSQRVLGERYADRALEKIYGISPGVVTVYAANELHSGLAYTGYSSTLPVGEYDRITLERKGILADNIRSARVDEGYELVLITSEGEEAFTTNQANITPKGSVQGVLVREAQ